MFAYYGFMRLTSFFSAPEQTDGVWISIFPITLFLYFLSPFKPKNVGDRVRMHPLVVFFSILGGLKAFWAAGNYLWAVDCHFVFNAGRYIFL